METRIETSPQERAGQLLGYAAGYVAHRFVAMGLRTGLIAALADTPATAAQLADRLDLDPFYVQVWCQGALAAGLCDEDDGRFSLVSHAATLLLDDTSPGYVGGIFPILEQHELFGRFEQELPSGERLWWDDTSPEFIRLVSSTGKPFYTRLVGGGLAQVPGLSDRLAAGGRIVDTACGSGLGLVALAEAFPGCTVVGVDGDAVSLAAAEKRLAERGLADRVTLIQSPLEDAVIPEAALIVNNISMHECRDIDAVTRNVHAGLEPGGWFVISDFPFPDTTEGLRTVPGRVMSGIQVFEAQIDDQLLPRRVYDQLLERHGFTDLGMATLTPVHALTWGRRR